MGSKFCRLLISDAYDDDDDDDDEYDISTGRNRPFRPFGSKKHRELIIIEL